jgi:glycosyltransferase domain-containing protein
VLDSSRPETLAANRVRVASSSLDVEFAEFADLEPAEKWRQGIHKVTTSFCALCADDDIVILAGVQRCLDALRTNLSASTVQGYSFTFLPRSDGDMELNNIVYFRPTIDDASPLQRLDKLFQQYQALSYGVFRTPTLRRILDALQPLTKTLARELLWSALTAVNGHVIRLPHFSYGRNMGASKPYDYWHPLEWFSKDPESLFAEYLRYRGLTAAAIIQRPDNEHQFDEIHEMLDLIHLRYLARHAPDSAVKFITEQQISGIDFAEYWPRHAFTALRRRRHSAVPRDGGVRTLEHPGARALLSCIPKFLRPAWNRLPATRRGRPIDQRAQRVSGSARRRHRGRFAAGAYR